MTKHKLFARALYAVMALALVAVMVPVTLVSAAGDLTVAVTPGDTTQGVTTTYNITFTTASNDTVGYVEMAFVSAFNVSGATLGTVKNIGVGELSNEGGNILHYTLTTEARIADNVTITINLSGIVNPATAGSYSVVVATKLLTATIDTGNTSVVIAAAPESFTVTVPSVGGNVTAGALFAVNLTALKATNVTQTETAYTGEHLITFTSAASEPKTIPAFEVVNFTAGVGTTSISFVLNKVETGKTITAAATTPTFSGTSAAINVDPAAVDHLTITGAPLTVVADVAFTNNVTVTAEDAGGNTITNYTHNVTWSGGGANAALAADYTFVPGDVGVHAFAGSEFTLKEVGDQIITVTDSDNTTIAGEAPITVTLPASKLAVAASLGTITADGYGSSTITATAKDAKNNTVTSYGADITFQTSVGGFTEADDDASYTVAAVDAEGVADGNATATLTSTDAGVATIKVTSGSLTYATTAVNLTAPGKATEVWVDDDYSGEGDDGGHDWAYDAFATIQGGINAVADGGTVNVKPGTYNDTGESLPVVANVTGVTLQSTGTAAETIIDCEDSHDGITITAANVTVDGFTVLDAADPAVHITGANVTVKGCTITSSTSLAVHGILVDDGATGAIISGNVIENLTESGGSQIALSGVSDCEVLDNTLTASFIWLAGVSNSTISGNDVSGVDDAGCITIQPTSTDILIQGNSLSDGAAGIVIPDTGSADPLLVEGLQILGNDITLNTKSNGEGIAIGASIVWGVGNAITNNNITGNTEGIHNYMTTIIDAENNWWGDDSGPYHNSTNPAATGDVVSDAVDYRPWLTAEYGVAEVSTIDLKADWNFVSLPKKVESPTFGDLLSAWTGWTGLSYDPVAGWTSLVSSDSINDDILAGYWVSVDTPGTISVVYKSEGATVPPSKSLTGDAWNAIGFSSTTALDADTALMSIEGSWSTLIAWDAEGQAYEDSIIVGQTGNMSPGKGYWVWMTTGDVLSAISA